MSGLYAAIDRANKNKYSSEYYDFDKSGQPVLKEGYNTSGSIGGSKKVHTIKGSPNKYQRWGKNSYKWTGGTPDINIYKLPGQQAPAKAEAEAEAEAQAPPPVINNVYQDRIKDLEATNAARAYTFSTEYGERTDRFGRADYNEASKRGSDTDIFNFLNKNQGILAAHNSAGQAGGLYETLKAAAAREEAAKPDFGAQLAKIQQEQTAYLNNLQVQQNQRLDKMAAEQKAAAEELALGQRTSLLNQARSGQMGALQIGGASQTPRTGGTQGFKRRKLQINPVTANALSGILGGTSAATQTNVLNV